jgi:SAM-dependent methyltransferase
VALDSEANEGSMSFLDWYGYVKRMVRGRPAWAAGREFAYYCADAKVVADHRERQEALARQLYLPGLRIVRALGILDADLLRGARVLDLGAGECWVAEAIAQVGGAAEVWAVDAVPKQIWAAAAKYAQHPRLRFVVADVCDLPFADGQFDVVVGNLVLHHVHPLERLLAEVRRVLTPGGRFAAFEPNPLYGALVHEKTSENEAPLLPGTIVRAARAAGFADARCTFWWSRFETSTPGVLCPGYRIQAALPGARGHLVGGNPVVTRRDLRPMRLAGLRLDAGCQFADLALEQEALLLGFAA